MKLFGCNYIPKTAINQLEMWQAKTFDPFTIDKELTWAASLGMNSVRVFLHSHAFYGGIVDFLERIDQFLIICKKHGIRPLFVFWDSVWNPEPKIGIQPEGTPNVHNSGWLQDPGTFMLHRQQMDFAAHTFLKHYIKTVVGEFRNDTRILGWDLFNEPCNQNIGSYNDGPKADAALSLLRKTVGWVKKCNPVQPVTMGVWANEWTEEKLTPLDRYMLQNSDVISFHSYDAPEVLEGKIQSLLRYNKPMWCTEFMARPLSTFENAIPLFEQYDIGAFSWGLVKGKTQTHCPWSSWGNPAEPEVWFHDILHPDGTPYDEREAEYLRSLKLLRTVV